MKTYKEIILDYLIKNETITSLQCQRDLYILDLQHYIMELRNEGYPITDRWIKKRNSEGRSIKYKEYRLEV